MCKLIRQTKMEIPIITNYDNGKFWVESDVRQFCFLLGRHKLLTDRFVFVDVKVVHVRLVTVTCNTTG